MLLLRKDIEAPKQSQTVELAESLRVGLSVEGGHDRVSVSNVVGYLRGSPDHYLVIGAHDDRLGLGGDSPLAPSQVG